MKMTHDEYQKMKGKTSPKADRIVFERMKKMDERLISNRLISKRERKIINLDNKSFERYLTNRGM